MNYFKKGTHKLCVPKYRRLWVAAVFFSCSAVSRAETVIKFATLAPQGSTWMKVMTDFDKEVQAKTAGRVKFKFYAGGVSGDEKDVIRKIRVGQLQSAGVTGVGLGEITPEVRVLDAPYLFQNAGEVDHILGAFDKDLRGALEKNGFTLLGWTEVGFVYLFTNTPIKEVADLKTTKMWVWEGDPIAEAAFKAAEVHPIPLSITDVTPSLQTGLINGVYSSPMAAIALQWFTKTKYICGFPIAYSAGGVIVSNKAMDTLSKEDRQTLLDLGKQHMRRLTTMSRDENKQALETLKKEGLSITEPSAQAVNQYKAIGEKARQALAGTLYSRELLEKIEKSLGDYRAHPGQSPHPAHGKAQTH